MVEGRKWKGRSIGTETTNYVKMIDTSVSKPKLMLSDHPDKDTKQSNTTSYSTMAYVIDEVIYLRLIAAKI